jgi:hypothetical protein
MVFQNVSVKKKAIGALSNEKIRKEIIVNSGLSAIY